MHVRPGCRSSGCPVAVFTAVGTIWRASKLGGLNIKKISAASKISPREVVFADEAGSRPKRLVGKAANTDEETGIYSLWDRWGTGSSISEKFDSKRNRSTIDSTCQVTSRTPIAATWHAWSK